jgi:hypothetical protein
MSFFVLELFEKVEKRKKEKKSRQLAKNRRQRS